MPTMIDRLGRGLRDLRISVTDRCNFRCTYCMPKAVFGKGYQYAARQELLSYEEIIRVVNVFVQLGLRKLRLTGGEPLLRRDLAVLIAEIHSLHPELDISLTSNASLLTAATAQQLHAAGLQRLNISLDALDDASFKRLNDVDFPVSKVLQGIDHAAAAGFSDIKINMVVKRGANEHSILPMADYFRQRGHVLRFIEYMDVGSSNGWQLREVVSAREILACLQTRYELEPVAAHYQGEVAERWRYKDGGGEIGVIASVTQAFCRDCNRARLSAVGQLYTCLFASHGHDLRTPLRNACSDADLMDQLQQLWQQRSDRYSEIRGLQTTEQSKVEMSHIGG